LPGPAISAVKRPLASLVTARADPTCTVKPAAGALSNALTVTPSNRRSGETSDGEVDDLLQAAARHTTRRSGEDFKGIARLVCKGDAGRLAPKSLTIDRIRPIGRDRVEAPLAKT
jgi:hypothetical protein